MTKSKIFTANNIKMQVYFITQKFRPETKERTMPVSYRPGKIKSKPNFYSNKISFPFI